MIEPSAVSASEGVYVGVIELMSSKVPVPSVDHVPVVVVPPDTLPARITTALLAQTDCAGPASTKIPGLIVTVTLAATSAHDPEPVVVSVRTALPAVASPVPPV